MIEDEKKFCHIDLTYNLNRAYRILFLTSEYKECVVYYGSGITDELLHVFVLAVARLLLYGVEIEVKVDKAIDADLVFFVAKTIQLLSLVKKKTEEHDRLVSAQKTTT